MFRLGWWECRVRCNRKFLRCLCWKKHRSLTQYFCLQALASRASGRRRWYREFLSFSPAFNAMLTDMSSERFVTAVQIDAFLSTFSFFSPCCYPVWRDPPSSKKCVWHIIVPAQRFRKMPFLLGPHRTEMRSVRKRFFWWRKSNVSLAWALAATVLSMKGWYCATLCLLLLGSLISRSRRHVSSSQVSFASVECVGRESGLTRTDEARRRNWF